jgi:hypothetical protein
MSQAVCLARALLADRIPDERKIQVRRFTVVAAPFDAISQ